MEPFTTRQSHIITPNGLVPAEIVQFLDSDGEEEIIDVCGGVEIVTTEEIISTFEPKRLRFEMSPEEADFVSEFETTSSDDSNVTSIFEADEGFQIMQPDYLAKSVYASDYVLDIVTQPESHYRPRYQSECSRIPIKGMIADSFPTVRLSGYYQPTKLQVYIGMESGNPQPHLFLQASKVTTKSWSTSFEKNVQNTTYVEFDLLPEKDMTAVCDSVGVIKKRIGEIRQLPTEPSAQAPKKKITFCRLVFKVQITRFDGIMETLQICSNPINCAQAPGEPLIRKMSLQTCAVEGGEELFIIGKRFNKDTKVYFEGEDFEVLVSPIKEYLQHNHLICVIPMYKKRPIFTAIPIEVSVISNGLQSKPFSFAYLPTGHSQYFFPPVKVETF